MEPMAPSIIEHSDCIHNDDEIDYYPNLIYNHHILDNENFDSCSCNRFIFPDILIPKRAAL